MSYQKISKHSQDSIAHELDLFSVPLTKTSVLEGEVHEIGSIRTPNGSGPIEFEIDGNTDHYVDLNNSFIHVQCKIINQKGDNLSTTAADVKVAPSNNLLHTLFRSMTIQINGKEIEHEANYAYKAYLATTLNYGKEAKDTHLRSSYWINDDMGEEHTSTLSASQKTKIAARAGKLVGSKTLDMIGRLNSPLFNQPRYLIPGLNILLRLQPSTPDFVLQMTEEEDKSYSIKITKIELLVRKIRVHPSISTSHSALLSQGKKVQYPVNQTETQFFTISPGRQSERIHILQNKQEAKIVIVGLLSHTAKNGSYVHSPFKFENFNVSSINLTVNGHNVLNNPLQLGFNNNIYVRAYHNLQSVCDKTFMNEGNNVSLEEFKKSICLFAFDNTPDQCHGEGVHLIRHSTTTLDLTFRTALTETVSVLVYTEFDDLIEIDKTRVVTRASAT